MSMKLIKNISILFVAFAAIFVSCDDEIVREPSPEANPNANRVYFPDQVKPIGDRTKVLSFSDTNFELTIAREVTTSALTVALKLTGTDASLFSIPADVTFAAGASEATISVGVGAIELLKPYSVFVELADPDQIDPYFEGVPGISYSVLKEDFAPYAKGLYTSGWYEEVWSDYILEYSPSVQQYRIKAFCGNDGYNALFKWDGGSTLTMQGGSALGTRTGFQTGYVHPSYGMVYASFSPAEGDFTYDSTTKTFSFGYAWRVSAGGFGVSPDTFEIETLY